MSESIPFSGPPICVVGNINRDGKLLGVPASPALLSDGETPAAGVIETIGGGGANSACVAAALGAEVRFLGKTGADDLGRRLERVMEQHGVRMFLAPDTECVTGTTAALNYVGGGRHFVSCQPNNRRLRFEDLELDALDGCAHLLRADVWFSEEMLESGNRRLFTEARRRGLVTSLDINFDPQWSAAEAKTIARRKGLLRDVLGLVDIAHGNKRELCEFTGAPHLDAALDRLSNDGVKAVVVHLGAQGAGYYGGGEWIIEPPCPAERMVNCTGTGDVLSMCMILLHSRPNLPIQRKLALSNRVVSEFMEGRRAMLPAV